MDRRGDILRFGADGWSARFEDTFTGENVARMADALGLVWADAAPGARVYVGFDTRHAADAHARLVAGVLASYGLDVRLSDRPCPTPAVAWSCARDERAVGAVIVTASSRSCEYGGILVRGSDGGPVPREFLDDVEQAVSLTPTAGRGAFEECDLVSAYRASLAGHVDADVIAAARPRVVVDAMYGSGTGVLADLLRDLGCEVVEIHVEDREDFGGIHPDPSDPWADSCEQAVVAHGARMGLLLDGDGDRAAVVDENGTILAPRTLVPLLMGHLVENRGERGRVVSTLTCSACVRRQAERLGCDITEVPVGFSRIYRELGEGDVLLATEEYGGVCVPAHLRERDGLLVCLLAVELVCKTGLAPTELVSGLGEQVGTMSYARRDVRLESAASQAFRNVLPGLNPQDVAGRAPVEVSHADGMLMRFEDDSWLLMRPSRTSSVVRVYAEAPTSAERDELLSSAVALLRLPDPSALDV
ncbi:phosphoglucomutase [Thermophilibacter sp.]